MNAVENQVRELVAVELESANRQFPQFHSPHEGWAVIMEELEESEEALRMMRLDTEIMWRNIRDNIECKVQANSAHEKAIKAACEVIQFAAMTQKYMDMETNHDD